MSPVAWSLVMLAALGVVGWAGRRFGECLAKRSPDV